MYSSFLAIIVSSCVRVMDDYLGASTPRFDHLNAAKEYHNVFSSLSVLKKELQDDCGASLSLLFRRGSVARIAREIESSASLAMSYSPQRSRLHGAVQDLNEIISIFNERSRHMTIIWAAAAVFAFGFLFSIFRLTVFALNPPPGNSLSKEWTTSVSAGCSWILLGTMPGILLRGKLEFVKLYQLRKLQSVEQIRHLGVLHGLVTLLRIGSVLGVAIAVVISILKATWDFHLVETFPGYIIAVAAIAAEVAAYTISFTVEFWIIYRKDPCVAQIVSAMFIVIRKLSGNRTL
jgi:hypothetical protein